MGWTFRGGFTEADFGYDPNWPPKMTDEEREASDASSRAEHKELFGENGYVERSMAVDALGGNIELMRRAGLGYRDPRAQIALAARRHVMGVKLPSTRQIMDIFPREEPSPDELALRGELKKGFEL